MRATASRSAPSGRYSEQGLAQRYRAIRRGSEKRDNIARGEAVGDWQGGLSAADRAGHRKRKCPFGNLPAFIAAGSKIFKGLQ